MLGTRFGCHGGCSMHEIESLTDALNLLGLPSDKTPADDPLSPSDQPSRENVRAPQDLEDSEPQTDCNTPPGATKRQRHQDWVKKLQQGCVLQ
jgi:hypothetical protein